VGEVSSSAITNFPAPSPFLFDHNHLLSGNLVASFSVLAELTVQDQPGDVHQFTVNLPSESEVFSDVTQSGINLFANNISTSGSFDCGAIVFVPVATPEPSSVTLMLLGVGVVFLMPKKVLSRASDRPMEHTAHNCFPHNTTQPTLLASNVRPNAPPDFLSFVVAFHPSGQRASGLDHQIAGLHPGEAYVNMPRDILECM
jgi:hypothetical protein